MANDRAIKVLAPAGANAAASSSAGAGTIVQIDAAAELAWALVSAMERRLGWRRSVCSIVLVLGIVLVIGAVVLVLAGAASGVPHILDKVRHHGPGNFLNGGNNSLDMLKAQAGAITSSVRKVSAGVVHVGLSTVGAVTV
jgi:predicted PurR-regulated permease PerM